MNMPPGQPATPTPVPDPPKGRLQQALELIVDEAAEVLAQGRDPRAFTRTEKLLAIARALRLECGNRVEDVVQPKRQGGINLQGGAVFNVGNAILGDEAPYGGNATQDFRREEKLVQIEALAARKRKDDAQGRLALIQEFKELNDLDTSKLPNEIREGIEARLAQITDELHVKKVHGPPESKPEAETA